ncbi:MAG: ABC transporter permease [Actinomycetota bacterium]|nr:ABC transporter permease [Actinomycetota bacterium]
MRSKVRPGDLVGLGARGLAARPARAVLTAVGIAIGIAAIVAVIGISASGRADLIRTLDRLGTNLLRVTPGTGILGGDTEVPEEARVMAARIGPVESATQVTAVDATVRRNDLIGDLETGGIGVFAARTDLLAELSGQLATGRFLDGATERVPAVVLGDVAAARLGIADLDPRPRVFVGDTWFTVIGILDGLSLHPDLERGALIGYPVAAALFDTGRSPTTLYVRADPDSLNDVAEVIPATVNPQQPDAVEVTRPADALLARRAADQALTGLLIGLGAVALLVAGVAIANIMVMSVLERRTEIGVRRALGATRGHIRMQFLVESMLLALIGGVAGTLLGAAITAAFAANRGLTLDVPPAGIAASIGVALLVGALAGLYPARRAARIPPAEAVRK